MYCRWWRWKIIKLWEGLEIRACIVWQGGRGGWLCNQLSSKLAFLLLFTESEILRGKTVIESFNVRNVVL